MNGRSRIMVLQMCLSIQHRYTVFVYILNIDYFFQKRKFIFLRTVRIRKNYPLVRIISENYDLMEYINRISEIYLHQLYNIERQNLCLPMLLVN